MKRALFILPLFWGVFLSFSSTAQTDERDKRYTPPSYLGLDNYPLYFGEENSESRSNHLVKFHPLELLRGQFILSYELAIDGERSVEIFAGTQYGNDLFGNGGGIIGRIMDGINSDLTAYDLRATNISAFGTRQSIISPVLGVGLKGFFDTKLSNKLFRYAQLYYRFATKSYDLNSMFGNPAVPEFQIRKLLNEDSQIARLQSHSLALKIGYQYFGQGNYKLSNEIGLTLGFNLNLYPDYITRVKMINNINYAEYFKNGRINSRVIPLLQFHYSIGIGR
jgi:hypothetical protein